MRETRDEPFPLRCWVASTIFVVVFSVILSRIGIFAIDWLTLNGLYNFFIYFGAVAFSSAIAVVGANEFYEEKKYGMKALKFLLLVALPAVVFVFIVPFVDPALDIITYFVDVGLGFVSYWIMFIIFPIFGLVMIYFVWG